MYTLMVFAIYIIMNEQFLYTDMYQYMLNHVYKLEVLVSLRIVTSIVCFRGNRNEMLRIAPLLLGCSQLTSDCLERTPKDLH